MATKKPIPTAKTVTPAATFEAELELAINNMCKDAPEFTTALKEELDVLKARILDAHKLYSKQESAEKDKQLEEAHKVIALMDQDMNSLKTTILRMAVTQYGG